jgi:hypothetical protein
MTATIINNAAVFTALDAYAASQDQARVSLVAAFKVAGIKTYEAALPVVTAWAATRTKCPLIEGKGKGKGTMVLDREAPTYEAAKKARYRALEAFKPPVKAKPPVHKKEPVAVAISRAQRAAIRSALADFGGDTKALIAAIKTLTA